MMNCKEALEKLYNYLDQHEIEEISIVEIEMHLKACRGCLDHFEFERKLIARVKTCCAGEKVPESVVLRIRKILREL